MGHVLVHPWHTMPARIHGAWWGENPVFWKFLIWFWDVFSPRTQQSKSKCRVLVFIVTFSIERGPGLLSSTMFASIEKSKQQKLTSIFDFLRTLNWKSKDDRTNRSAGAELTRHLPSVEFFQMILIIVFGSCSLVCLSQYKWNRHVADCGRVTVWKPKIKLQS